MFLKYILFIEEFPSILPTKPFLLTPDHFLDLLNIQSHILHIVSVLDSCLAFFSIKAAYAFFCLQNKRGTGLCQWFSYSTAVYCAPLLMAYSYCFLMLLTSTDVQHGSKSSLKNYRQRIQILPLFSPPVNHTIPILCIDT